MNIPNPRDSRDTKMNIHTLKTTQPEADSLQPKSVTSLFSVDPIEDLSYPKYIFPGFFWRSGILVICVICIVVHAGLLFYRPVATQPLMLAPRTIAEFADVPTKISHGEVWRLASAVFIHSGANHLLSNLIGLLFLGFSEENRYGTGIFSLYFLCSGVLSFLIANSFSYCTLVACGASGAIYGVIGMKVTNFALGWHKLENKMNQLLNFVIWIFVSIGLGSASNANIAHGVHFGGFVTGVCFSLLMREDEEGDPQWPIYATRLSSGITFFLVAFGVFLGFMSVPQC